MVLQSATGGASTGLGRKHEQQKPLKGARIPSAQQRWVNLTAKGGGPKSTLTWRPGFLCELDTPANPSRAAAMEPMVTAMCSQERKVRSLAKKVLGSMRMGVVRAMGGGSLVLRLLKYQSKKPFLSFFCPKPALFACALLNPPCVHAVKSPDYPDSLVSPKITMQ